MSSVSTSKKQPLFPNSKITLKESGTTLLKWGTFLLPVVLFLTFLGIKISSPETYGIIVQEDTAIEWFQSLFFLLASVVSFFILLKFFRRRLVLHSILYGILALGLLFITMEEISWGQRIFGVETTGYFSQHNMQNEITLHNLKPVAPLLSKLYLLIGLIGTFGWIVVSRIRLKRQIPFASFYIPVWYTSSYFFPVLLVYGLISFVRPYAVEVLGIEELRMGHFLIYRDQEPAELLLSLGFFFFVTANYLRLKRLESPGAGVPRELFHFRMNPKSKKTNLVLKDRSAVPSKTEKHQAIKSPTKEVRKRG